MPTRKRFSELMSASSFFRYLLKIAVSSKALSTAMAKNQKLIMGCSVPTISGRAFSACAQN